MKKLLSLLVIVSMWVGAGTGYLYGQYTFEPQHIIVRVPDLQVEYVDKPVIVEKVVVKPVYIDRHTNTIIVVSPDAMDEELEQAFEAIKYGRRSHQSIANNPQWQNRWTGNTEWNIEWVDNYDLFRELIERAYGLDK